MPELTLPPSQGSINSATDISQKYTIGIIIKGAANTLYPAKKEGKKYIPVTYKIEPGCL
jgi:hypothetical protein